MTTNMYRPRLWHLPPVGVGTPGVESADSYLGRLAQAHGVPRQTLHKFINGHGPAIYQNLRGQPPRLDVPSQQAAAYMRRVADLVGHPEVETLGLRWLADRVRAQHVFRSDRAWCPACLAEMQTGPGLHTPLIWGLASVTHCPCHRVRLRTACPACGAKGSIRRVGAGDGANCASCGATLAAVDGEAAEPMSDVEAAVLEQMGLLVSVVASQAVGSESPSFGEIVTMLHRQGHHVKACEMARRMGVSKGTVSTLMSGRTQPGIDLLLRLSTAYAVQLPELLLKRSGDSEWRKRAAVHRPVVWQARARPRIDWAGLQQQLELEMASEAALPVAQVAKRLQIDPRHLTTRHSECASFLNERYQLRVQRERTREVNHVLEMIQSMDDCFSQRAIARRIGISRTSELFRRAWR